MWQRVHIHLVWGAEASTEAPHRSALPQAVVPCSPGTWFQAHEAGQRSGCLARHRALLVVLIPRVSPCCPGVCAVLTPSGCQSWDAGGCITHVPSPAELSAKEKDLLHGSLLRCTSGLWRSWRSSQLPKWVFLIPSTLRQNKPIYKGI